MQGTLRHSTPSSKAPAINDSSIEVLQPPSAPRSNQHLHPTAPGFKQASNQNLLARLHYYTDPSAACAIMVLEGASVPESVPYDQDGTPSSDLDPYDGSQKPASFKLDDMGLPSPFPVFGPLMGYTKSELAKNITRGFAAAGQLLHRPLSNQEADALAYNIAKMERTSSYGSVLGLSAGLYRAWSTAATFRFPLFQPNPETFNPNSFAMLRGPAARAAIHSLRGLAYGSTGLAIGGIFVKSYGAVIFATAIKTDPRLKDMNEAVSETKSRHALVPNCTCHDHSSFLLNVPREFHPYVARNLQVIGVE
jgi:hypothetical protein